MLPARKSFYLFPLRTLSVKIENYYKHQWDWSVAIYTRAYYFNLLRYQDKSIPGFKP